MKLNKINIKLLKLTDLSIDNYNLIFRLYLSFCKLLYKLINNKIPLHLFIFDRSNIPHNNTLILKHISTEKYKCSYYYICTLLYNILVRKNISFLLNYQAFLKKCILLYRNEGEQILFNILN